MARILLAEDDESMRQFLVLALQRAGHEVMPCQDGLEALSVIERDPAFDLLLADIVMPGMDGIELSHKATAVKPTLKVMFITGFAAVAMQSKDEAGKPAVEEAQVLSKPFHLKDLVDRVEQLLAA